MLEERQRRIAEFIASFRVKPGAKVKLAKDFDPSHKATFIKKKDGVKLLQEGVELLAEYQSRLAAQDTWGVLVCLQALDAAGKDGTIRHVMSGVNPQGVSVHSFNVPSAEELDHDYLWRYAKRLPRRGDIGIFNRSHYEEVLVVRVHPKNLERQRLPKQARGEDVWEHRYRDINAWERHLARQRLQGGEAPPQHLPGGAAAAIPGADRRARQELEVLGQRRQGALVLGRLPDRLL